MEDLLKAGLDDRAMQNLFGLSERRMLWQCKWDNRFCYYVYVPASRVNASKPSKVFVCIHGTARRYETEQYQVYCNFAEVNNCVILFPVFPGGAVEENNYNDYKLIVSSGFHYDELLLAMIDEIAKRYGNIDTDKFFLVGHSGGGQFVNRFLYLHPDRILGTVISAPGRQTYLDKNKDFYWGIRNWADVFEKEICMEALRKVPVMLAVGELDQKYIGESPYGSNRRERMASLKKNFEENGISTEFFIIPGMEHAFTVREGFEKQCEFCSRILKTE